jgi:hypothetical protein
MAIINAYVPKLRALTPMFSGMGYDEANKNFIKFKGEYEHYHVLDALTAAVEAGQIDSDTWVATVFSDKAEFAKFLEALESWSDTERFHDRWALALAEITDCVDDEYSVTGAEAATTFLNHAQETGQA